MPEPHHAMGDALEPSHAGKSHPEASSWENLILLQPWPQGNCSRALEPFQSSTRHGETSHRSMGMESHSRVPWAWRAIPGFQGHGEPLESSAGCGKPSHSSTRYGDSSLSSTGHGEPFQNSIGHGEPFQNSIGHGEPSHSSTGHGKPFQSSTRHGELSHSSVSMESHSRALLGVESHSRAPLDMETIPELHRIPCSPSSAPAVLAPSPLP